MTDHVAMGWLCPRCGHVWAPDVRECTCVTFFSTAAAASAQDDKAGWYETMTLDMSQAEVR